MGHADRHRSAIRHRNSSYSKEEWVRWLLQYVVVPLLVALLPALVYLVAMAVR
jgi:hypothetical protein